MYVTARQTAGKVNPFYCSAKIIPHKFQVAFPNIGVAVLEGLRRE